MLDPKRLGVIRSVQADGINGYNTLSSRDYCVMLGELLAEMDVLDTAFKGATETLLVHLTKVWSALGGPPVNVEKKTTVELAESLVRERDDLREKLLAVEVERDDLKMMKARLDTELEIGGADLGDGQQADGFKQRVLGPCDINVSDEAVAAMEKKFMEKYAGSDKKGSTVAVGDDLEDK